MTSSVSLPPGDLVQQRDAWLEQRRQGIGSSDVASILGMSPWVDSSPLAVYLDKLGQLPEKTGAQLGWGHRHEPAIAGYYQDLTGRILQPSALAVHPQHSWLMATPDRFAGDRIVELKTAGKADGWGEQGTDQVPEAYLLQVQHQMHVCGVDLADVCVLIGLFDCRIYTVRYSPDLYALVFPILRDFWDRVQRRDPPPVDWSHPSTPALIEALYRPIEGHTTDLGKDAAHWVREYLSLGETLRTTEKERELAKAHIIEAMGGASVGLLPDGTEVLRTICQRKGYTVDPGEYVRMTVRQPRRRKGDPS